MKIIKPRIEHEDLLEIAKRAPIIDKKSKEKEKPKTPNQTPIPTLFKDSGTYWEIQGVEYKNKIHTVNLLKSLLDQGSLKTQEDWAQYSIQAKAKGEFCTGDMPLQHALFTALYYQKDNPELEQAREFIKENMRNRWLTTLTRIVYQPTRKDKIIHNFQMPDQYELKENIVGKDRKIISDDKPSLKALLGTDNINQIKQVYNWINQTPTWIWRLNSKPGSIDERVAWFSALSDGAGLVCDRRPQGSDASLGVFVCA